ncbi:MAG: putative Riboflavin biosynthesis protein [Conexibacter sp.]|nr:putative Riboflavin biosynthesis protein [Conexibacter sp.]
MSKVTAQVAISLDGYVAGPEQSEENPIGVGGMRLHDWHREPEGQSAVDAEVTARMLEGNGAYVMGRNMFGPIRGPWSGDWRGWWGPEPPYHAPVFVLTHEPRESLAMEGGTTFHFVTEGFDAALSVAREAAGSLNVAIAGGASAINQALAAGVVDELFLHVVPIVLGAGARLLEGVGTPSFEIAEVLSAPAVTHIRYRAVR